MTQVEKNADTFVQIYLFDSTGNFYWCNGSANVDIEDQAVLHAGLFATLHNFTIETLGEKLKYLLINELRINMFSILDTYLVAVVTPKFLKLDTQQIEVIKTKIRLALSDNTDISVDEEIPIITDKLNILLEELLSWIDTYVNQANRAMNVFTAEIEEIDKIGIGVFLYTWDWNRVFKYIPSSNSIDYKIEQLIDETIVHIELMSDLHGSTLIQNNTLIHFYVDDLVLILTRSFEDGELLNSLDALNQSISYFEQVLSKIFNTEEEDQDG